MLSLIVEYKGQGILEDKDKTRRYLSEDFYFCALWQQCGGEIWTDITSELKHIGIKTYERKPIAKRSYEKEKKVIVLFGTFIILF